MQITIVLGLSIFLQFAAAAFALRLIGITRRRTAWALIAVAISMMAIRRCITLTHFLLDDPNYPLPDLVAERVALIISFLMVSGVALIGPVFRRLQQSQEALRESEARLAHAARLSTVGEMAAALVHEINQPLCAVSNFTDACLNNLNNKGEQSIPLIQEHLKQISDASSRANKIVRRMGRFTRLSEAQFVPLELNEIIRESITFIAVEVRHSRIDIHFMPQDPLPRVLGDEIQIQQVLVNLLRNACESLGEAPFGQRDIIIRTSILGDSVAVSIEDGGQGLPEGDYDKVFETFYTTKVAGLGIGLAVSRTIIETHQGKLWATPNTDQGATFHFTLPIEKPTKSFVAVRPFAILISSLG